MYSTIIFIVLALCILAGCGYFSLKVYRRYRECTRLKMSFAESLRLCDLPIVCFNCNGKALNLLVDSGANNNVVDASILDSYPYKETEYSSILQGVTGDKATIPFVIMNFDYKGEEYMEAFQAADVSSLFGEVKKETGVHIHGILGNKFFQKHKYILDFDENVFYHV